LHWQNLGKQKATNVADSYKIYWTDTLDSNRTYRLIDWLDEHPSARHMLFSDSTQDARAEGHRKDVGKTQKSTYHAMIAQYVFTNDKNPEYVQHYHENPAKFAKSVVDRLTMCAFPF
jgi:hypothetical protein